MVDLTGIPHNKLSTVLRLRIQQCCRS